jgi:hypothetical protein
MDLFDGVLLFKIGSKFTLLHLTELSNPQRSFKKINMKV